MLQLISKGNTYQKDLIFTLVIHDTTSRFAIYGKKYLPVTKSG